MTIIDEAIELEERSLSYYKEAAGRVSDPGGRKILELLAKEEERHISLLSEMKQGGYGPLEGLPLIAEVRGLVEGAVKEGRNAIFTDASIREILQKAMEIEQSTRRFYKERRAATDDEKQKELFEVLAEQETGHYLMVSGLVEYFDRPADWVESAEFGLRPEY